MARRQKRRSPPAFAVLGLRTPRRFHGYAIAVKAERKRPREMESPARADPRQAKVSVAAPTNRDSCAFGDEQGELLRAVVSALCAARLANGERSLRGATRGRAGDTRAIGGTRRGPTRRERVRLRPPVQSLCPLDAWRTLRDEPWRRYRHHLTTTEEHVMLAGGSGGRELDGEGFSGRRRRHVLAGALAATIRSRSGPRLLPHAAVPDLELRSP